MMRDDPGIILNTSFSGHSHGNGHGEEDSPFFADMTLDLAEAHDIAETPEPTRKTLVESGYLRDIPKMPPIPDRVPEPSSPSFAQPAGMTAATESSHFDFDDRDSKPLASISNQPPAATAAAPFHNRPQQHTPSTRRWPRDVQWAVAFCLVVPISLLFPLLVNPADPTPSWIATAPAPRLATLHTLLWGYGAAFVLTRLLYRTMGGGDGDDARHVASQLLLASAPISVSVYLLLLVVMYISLPHAKIFLLIPLWYLARDIFLFRTWKITATTPGGRQAFFEALACMTLDILSRSLRRSSFCRMVSFLVIVQLLVIAWWRWALLAALQSQSMLWIVMAAVGGKWATGTVARLLTLIAAGGIQSWFAEQDAHVRAMRGNSNQVEDAHEDSLHEQDEEMIEFTALTRNANGYEKASDFDSDEIQEAYRTADASIYKSSLVPDEGMDDDFEDEYQDRPDNNNNNMSSTKSKPRFFLRQDSQQSSTVKQLLTKGLTQNFGSVAKCGLLGGVAQFMWSQLRKIDTARATFRNLQGMPIGHSADDATTWWDKAMLKANRIAREFVRNNSDMAMCHVAAYSKSYQRAAQDVAILIDESGVEPMIHEDIATHMSSCVGGSVSGVIVMFTGIVLVHQRNRNHPQIPDSAVVLDMLLAFVFCYTLIFTVMEPLRASIKAVYISFAQYPQALSQSFPLIYHRLSRMSQSNLQ